jgi:hypothetical protein
MLSEFHLDTNPSNFKHWLTMNFNGKEMKWMMMSEFIEFGTKFFAGCLEIQIVAMYVECRSLKAWHNTWCQILWWVGQFQWWQASPHFLWMTTSTWCHNWKYILSKFIFVLLIVYCWCSLVANLVFLHVHLGFSFPSNWEDFLHKRWKSLFKERKEITPFHFPYIHMTLGEAARTLVLGVIGWMTK